MSSEADRTHSGTDAPPTRARGGGADDDARGADPARLERAWDALRQVDDPEVGMNVVELGLVYGVELEPHRVAVRMTMTSAACPMGEDIVEDARHALRRAFPDLDEIDVELVWDPPWSPALMSEEARGFFGWQGE